MPMFSRGRRGRSALRFAAAGLFASWFVFPGHGHAFKIDTHVWVAQQVLNDVVPDGRVTIPPFGEFEVDPRIVDALNTHRLDYRMGAVGPDGFWHTHADLYSGGVGKPTWRSELFINLGGEPPPVQRSGPEGICTLLLK